jgi:hypothetical protein
MTKASFSILAGNAGKTAQRKKAMSVQEKKEENEMILFKKRDRCQRIIISILCFMLAMTV